MFLWSGSYRKKGQATVGFHRGCQRLLELLFDLKKTWFQAKCQTKKWNGTRPLGLGVQRIHVLLTCENTTDCINRYVGNILHMKPQERAQGRWGRMGGLQSQCAICKAVSALHLFRYFSVAEVELSQRWQWALTWQSHCAGQRNNSPYFKFIVVQNCI